MQPISDALAGGTNGLSQISGVQYAGTTMVAFTRPLAGNGATDVSIQNMTQYLLIASAPQDG